MKLHPQDLQKIARLTLEHYNKRAEEFWEGTRDHNVSQNIEALLRHIEGEPPFTILDFGCGPGRDLKAFAAKGHIAIGLEGAAHFAAMARAHWLVQDLVEGGLAPKPLQLSVGEIRKSSNPANLRRVFEASGAKSWPAGP